jgi:hypothetical protein
MKLHARAFLLVASFAGFAGLAVPAQAKAVIKTQTPCTTSQGYCLQILPTGTIPTIRSFQFTAPSKGTAEVTFHGSLVCTFANPLAGAAVVDLVSQIVLTAASVPDVNGPGALRHAGTLLPSTISFNLASTRVFNIPAAGTKTYHFRIARQQMGANSACVVHTATFTVVFVP